MRPLRPWASRRRELLRLDDGSASLEFLTLGVLMLVPLAYLVIALGAIQHQSLGVEAGARHIARVFAMESDGAAGSARAQRVLESVIDEYGLEASEVDVALACTPSGAVCPRPGAIVTVTVSARVRLPLVPPVLGLDEVTSIPVEASSSQKVSRFWEAP